MKCIAFLLALLSISLAQNYGYPPGVYNVVIREDYLTNNLCTPGALPDMIETWANNACQPDGSGFIFDCDANVWQINAYDNTTVCAGDYVNASSQNFNISSGSICVLNYADTQSAVLRCLTPNSTYAYPNTFIVQGYANASCQGIPAATTLFPMNRCINLGGGAWANYTCAGANAIGGVQCADAACSVNCTAASFIGGVCNNGANTQVPAICAVPTSGPSSVPTSAATSAAPTSAATSGPSSAPTSAATSAAANQTVAHNATTMAIATSAINTFTGTATPLAFSFVALVSFALALF